MWGDEQPCQPEVGAAKAMLDQTAEQFDVTRRAWSPMGATARPRWLGGWWTAQIEPHVVKLIDKAERTDGTFSRSDFAFVQKATFTSPRWQRAGKYRMLSASHAAVNQSGTMIYFAHNAATPARSSQCCPNATAQNRALRS